MAWSSCTVLWQCMGYSPIQSRCLIASVIESPGHGDDVQAIKAGVLEIADVLVVNKADHAGADVKRRQLESMLELRPPELPRDTPIIATVATEGRGVQELVDAIEQCHAARASEKIFG